MCEHRIDLARLGGEIGAGQAVVAVVAIDIRQKPLELLNVAIDGRPEIRIGFVAAANVVERLRTAPDIKLPGECVDIATPVLLPRFGNSRMTGSGSAVFARAGTGDRPQATLPAHWPAGWVGRMCRSLGAHPLAGWTED